MELLVSVCFEAPCFYEVHIPVRAFLNFFLTRFFSCLMLNHTLIQCANSYTTTKRIQFLTHTNYTGYSIKLGAFAVLRLN